MQSEIVRQRRPLWYRETAFGDDVMDAIVNIVRRDPFRTKYTGTKDKPTIPGLPIAIQMEEVAEELTRIKMIDPETGKSVRVGAGIESQQTALYRKLLDESVIFKVGYNHYADATRQQVIPVTRFFFDQIYREETRDCLDAMNATDIHLSLPRRTSKPLRNADGVFIRPGMVEPEKPSKVALYSDESERNMPSGEVYGIAIFAPGHRNGLIKAWNERGIRTTQGAVNAMANRLERALPGDKRISDMREAGMELIEHYRETLAPDEMADEE